MNYDNKHALSAGMQNVPYSMYSGFGNNELVPTPSVHEVRLAIRVDELERKLKAVEARLSTLEAQSADHPSPAAASE